MGDKMARLMQALLPSLLGETVELARDYSDVPAGTRGVVRAA
jgi:hypothetical protein